jgi:predicted  nucleic acid-binding Zn-ribbon protein
MRNDDLCIAKRDMAEDLKPLIELHYLDQKIAVLNSKISAVPIEIDELNRRLDTHQRSVKEKQDLIAANQKKRKELEGDLALIETKRTRYKEQLDTVKTNKEYTGLQHEIEQVSIAIRQIEDQILIQMEEAEQLKAKLEEAQKAKAAEEKVLEGDRSVLEGQAAKLREELEDLQKQRQGWIDQILPPTMLIYERTAQARRGIAMAEAKDAMCRECHVRIRPQLFQEIKRNDSIITCESCSRILFYVSPEGASKPDIETTNPKGEAEDVIRQ